MRWYYLACIVLTPLSAFSQAGVSTDTTEVNRLIALSTKDQWIDPDRSLEYAEQALELARKLNYKKGIAVAQNLKGFAFWSFGDNELAIGSAHEALDVATAENYTQPQAESYYIMARGYMDLREEVKAHESIVLAETLAKNGSDWTQLCSIYNLKGVILFNARKYDSALYYYKQAYDIGRTKGVDPINLPRIISNIGECYKEENAQLALRYYNEALALSKETNNKIAEASITSIIGHHYITRKELKLAEDNLQVALKLAGDLGLRRVMRHAYGGMVDIRLMQGKGNEAVVYLQKFYATRDSLLNTSKIRQIVELESNHELQLREKNIQLLESEKKVESMWRNLLIGFIALLVVIAIVVIQWQRYRYRRNRKMLNLEIDYLTQQHKEAVDKYKTLQISDAGDSMESYDQRVLKQAITIVEAHISDSQLSVEKLAEEMNMSRTSLHRKIKSITGFPPSELIRSIRLRQAARMIANRADSATQIAHAVGFDDYSHFSKAFKKHFGVPPSGYEDQVKALLQSDISTGVTQPD